MTAPLNRSDIRVLHAAAALANAGEEVTMRELARRCDRSISTINYSLHKLRAHGLVSFTHYARGTLVVRALIYEPDTAAS